MIDSHQIHGFQIHFQKNRFQYVVEGNSGWDISPIRHPIQPKINIWILQ